MQLHNLEDRTIGGYTTFGSVWEKNEVEQQEFVLINESGEQIPVQSRVTAWWPDGSIKWAAHTADSSKMGKNVTLKPMQNDQSVQEQKLVVEQKDGYFYVNTGKLSIHIPTTQRLPAKCLAENIKIADRLLISKAYAVLDLQHRNENKNAQGTVRESIEQLHYYGQVNSVELEEDGPLQCVFCFKGNHIEKDGDKGIMPYTIRLYLYAGSEEIKFVHTFFYDGKEEEDFLKAMGIRFEATLKGRPYNRHLKFGTDRNCFHEAAILLNSRYPRLAPAILEKQMAGEIKQYPQGSDVEISAEDLPIWDKYSICQDSPSHFLIKKQTKPECCTLNCLHGTRAPGSMSVHGENGGFILGIKDFWQKYPSGLEVDGLSKEKSNCTAWFYSPEVEAFDFRHYDTKSYPMTSYEGFKEVGASAYGVSVTSECRLMLLDEMPSDVCVEEFGHRVQKQAVYVGTPEYYHQKRAFGYWSLKKTQTQAEIWLEEQLEKAVEFYKTEVENRSWYGLFDYGDFMHTYDSIRHCWKYDTGGFAWQNTELVPTYWLWLYFLRTGREDVFTLVEAMSRHCSEVDMYHFGPMKGIGSRHNVRHWGCSCKEPRVSMAGHHRYFYYLTGDQRIGDVLDDVKDADQSMINLKYYRFKGENGGVSEKVSVRSGPDWSSFVSNWMTAYERTLDETYRKKIENGILDIANTPLGLASGPGYEYDFENAHLIYRGENDNHGDMHLQICMGGPEIWFETADMLEHDVFKNMLAEHGKFYFLSKEEKQVQSNGLIVNRPFSFPYFAAALAAYSASNKHDGKMAETVWKELLYALAGENQVEGFKACTYAITVDGKELQEIPWIKTNFSSQWCLNTIVVLDFIREYLPDTLENMSELLQSVVNGNFHNA